MDIAKLGEFGLIDHLTKDIKPQNESTKYGIGDDCAVLHYPDREVLVTTDMLMEGVHFDLTYTSMQHLGYKSAMVNISDIFAMNGTPRQLIVSIALSKRFIVEDLEDFYRGLRAACEKWKVDIVGGDTTSSYTGLAISITCIGEARKDDIVYRNGAHDTDLICVSGDLGAISKRSKRNNKKPPLRGEVWRGPSNPTSPARNTCCNANSSPTHAATSSRNCARQASVQPR